MKRNELKECLECWRRANWHCCEDKKKGIKPCHFDQHGKEIVDSIIEFFYQEGFFVKEDLGVKHV